MEKLTLFDLNDVPEVDPSIPDPVTLDAIADALGYKWYRWRDRVGYDYPRVVEDKTTIGYPGMDTDQFASYEASLECGRSYMVGDSLTTAEFVKRYGSSLTEWQKLAYLWCRQNPTKALRLESRQRDWCVYVRGEYVEFNLPHQDAGGEKSYITLDGKRKIHVNED